MTNDDKRVAPSLTPAASPYPNLIDPEVAQEETMHSKIDLNASTVDDQNHHYEFAFTGTGSEYFKIWIVNLALTIITLTLYHPWAKVRNKRYFYGNTWLNGHNFEYDAQPWKIFKGRLIALALLISYVLVSTFVPVLEGVFFIILVVAFPYVLFMSLRFNARYSSYRGIRFGFKGDYWYVLWYFAVYPFLAIFTFGLLFPHVWYKQKQYLVSQHNFGQKSFALNAKLSQFYVLGTLLLLFAIVGFGFVFYYLFKYGLPASGRFETSFAVVLVYFVLFLLFTLYWQRMYNLVYGQSVIANLRLQANMTYIGYMAIMFKNIVLILLTLGLYYPWAKIHIAKYKAQVTQIYGGDLEQFVAVRSEEKSALGDQVGDVFDLDVAI